MEPHTVKADRTGHVVEDDGVGRVLDFDRLIEVFKDALKADQRLGKFHLDVGEAADGAVEAHEIGGKGDDCAGADGIGEHHVAADPVDERGADGADQPQAQEIKLGDAGAADADGADFGVGVVKARGLARLGGEGLDQERAVDAERLADDVAHFGVVFHGLAADVTQDAPDAARREHEERHDQHGHDRQPPLDADHDDHGGDQGDDVGEDVGKGAGDGVLRADDIAVEARDDLAGFGVGEEADAHTLEVGIHLAAQIVDDTFAGARRVVTLY